MAKPKKDRKMEQWEKSIEGILYDLNSPCGITKEDEHNNYLIAEVLQRLPKKVREKILEEVVFIHTTAYGTVIKLYFQKFIEKTEAETPPKDEWIKPGFLVRIPAVFIVFNFKGIRKDETKMNTIAHEIAHFILSHKDSLKGRPSEKEEKMADDLAEKWDFGRCYKSYKRFKGSVSGL